MVEVASVTKIKGASEKCDILLNEEKLFQNHFVSFIWRESALKVFERQL